MLEIGTKAPDCEIETHTGYRGPLRTFWQAGPLILFFYPKDETRVCTKEACTLQASLEDFAQFGASVLGASTDSLKSHTAFAEKQGLTFPLVADPGGTLARHYDAFRSILRIAKRMTYVISDQGVILNRVHSELSVTAHLEMIQQTLEAARQ